MTPMDSSCLMTSLDLIPMRLASSPTVMDSPTLTRLLMALGTVSSAFPIFLMGLPLGISTTSTFLGFFFPFISGLGGAAGGGLTAGGASLCGRCGRASGSALARDGGGVLGASTAGGSVGRLIIRAGVSLRFGLVFGRLTAAWKALASAAGGWGAGAFSGGAFFRGAGGITSWTGGAASAGGVAASAWLVEPVVSAEGAGISASLGGN